MYLPPTKKETEMCLCSKCLNLHCIYKVMKNSVKETELPNSLTEFLCTNFVCPRNQNIRTDRVERESLLDCISKLQELTIPYLLHQFSVCCDTVYRKEFLISNISLCIVARLFTKLSSQRKKASSISPLFR